jgi:hypothetical protein
VVREIVKKVKVTKENRQEKEKEYDRPFSEYRSGVEENIIQKVVWVVVKMVGKA